MNRSGTGRVQHQAARVAMPGTARTSKATSPMASRDNSFRNTDPGLTRAKAEIDDPTTDDDGKLIGHDPEEDDDGNENTDPKGKKTKS